MSKIVDISWGTLKKVKEFLGINRQTAIRICILTVSSVLIPEMGLAANLSEVPGGKALGKLASWVTGPIPTTVGALAIGTSGAMLAFGEMGPAAKKVMQVALGTGCAMGAPALIDLVGENSTGLFF